MKLEPEPGWQIPARMAAFDLSVIALLWCASLAVTHPLGNFPLNDDWSYGLAVKHLLAHGDFRPTGWTQMTLVTHVLVGTLFSIPAGFSFSALKLSTLTMALLGIFATYLLMRELRQPRWLAILTSLTLAFSPIYYALAHTFMTDVPYTALAVMAAVCFVRNLRTGSQAALVLGALLAVAATLSRQLALSIPLAFAVAYILKNGRAKRSLLRAAIAPLLCLGALLVFQHWLAATGRLPAMYVAKNKSFFDAFIQPGTLLVCAKNGYVALLYLGWFLLPVLTLALGSGWESQRKKILVLLISSTGALLIGTLVYLALARAETRLLMPNCANIVIESGIGPLTLPDAYLLNLNKISALPDGFWLIVTVLSLFGAGLLIAAIGLSALDLVPKIRSARLAGPSAGRVFLLLGAALYLFPLLVSDFFDRHLVPALPLLAAGLAGSSLPVSRAAASASRVAAVAFLMAAALFSICGTRDYLAWNRVRWEALRDLREGQQVKAEEIDGGFEFNGWHFYDPQYQAEPGKSWWWVQDDSYKIGFGNMPGYTVVEERRYFHWLPPQAGKIVVLKKNLREP